MKRKILFVISCIGVLSIGAIFNTDLALSNTSSILSDQEMTQTFGKQTCTPCTLGKDEVVLDCLESDECWSCINFDRCLNADYAAGNYVYTCENTGIEDGTCYEGAELDCYQTYECDIIGTWYSDRICRKVLTGLCESLKTGESNPNGCVNCEKGDPFDDMETQVNWFCACP